MMRQSARHAVFFTDITHFSNAEISVFWHM